MDLLNPDENFYFHNHTTTYVFKGDEVERSLYLTTLLKSNWRKTKEIGGLKVYILDDKPELVSELYHVLKGDKDPYKNLHVTNFFMVDLWRHDDLEAKVLERNQKVFTLTPRFLQLYANVSPSTLPSTLPISNVISLWDIDLYKPLQRFSNHLSFGGNTVKKSLIKYKDPKNIWVDYTCYYNDLHVYFTSTTTSDLCIFFDIISAYENAKNITPYFKIFDLLFLVYKDHIVIRLDNKNFGRTKSNKIIFHLAHYDLKKLLYSDLSLTNIIFSDNTYYANVFDTIDTLNSINDEYIEYEEEDEDMKESITRNKYENQMLALNYSNPYYYEVRIATKDDNPEISNYVKVVINQDNEVILGTDNFSDFRLMLTKSNEWWNLWRYEVILGRREHLKKQKLVPDSVVEKLLL